MKNFIFSSQGICYLMLFLIVLFYSQGVFYPYGTQISTIAGFLLMMISALYFLFFRIILSKKTILFVKVWTALLICNVLYFAWDYTTVDSANIISVLFNMLPFYPFYIFSHKGILRRKHLNLVFFILLCLLSYRFINANITLQDLKNREDVIDNTIYMLLGLLPFTFLLKKKIFSIVSVLILWVFIVQSAKRAAIVVGVLTLIIFFYNQFQGIKKIERKRAFLKKISTLFLILFIGIWGYDYYSQNDFLVKRIQLMLAGDSSGRVDLIGIIFNKWYNSDNIFNYLFGRGFQSSYKFSGHASHNDWLELLVSFGLFGICIYIALFITAIKFVFNKRWVYFKRNCFICLIILGFVVSLTSRWYMSSFPYSQFLLLPYLLTTRDK
ncbi:O-antigen ligase family protein [Mesonia maritima]